MKLQVTKLYKRKSVLEKTVPLEIQHFHEHHKELDKFIHCARRVDDHHVIVKTHHGDHDHVVNLHVDYDRSLHDKAKFVEQIR